MQQQEILAYIDKKKKRKNKLVSCLRFFISLFQSFKQGGNNHSASIFQEVYFPWNCMIDDETYSHIFSSRRHALCLANTQLTSPSSQ